jgi:hypothetical protein
MCTEVSPTAVPIPHVHYCTDVSPLIARRVGHIPYMRYCSTQQSLLLYPAAYHMPTALRTVLSPIHHVRQYGNPSMPSLVCVLPY